MMCPTKYAGPHSIMRAIGALPVAHKIGARALKASFDVVAFDPVDPMRMRFAVRPVSTSWIATNIRRPT